jgi:hypothetical protein
MIQIKSKSDITIPSKNNRVILPTNLPVKLCVSIPCHDGKIYADTSFSLLALQYTCIKNNIEIVFHNVKDISIITKARNWLVYRFLKETDCTHLLFLDSDIDFIHTDVMKLIQSDKDIIGGSAPFKQIDWKNIKNALQKNPNLTPSELESCSIHHTVNLLNDIKIETCKPNKVKAIGTGFLLIKRSVFKKMIDSKSIKYSYTYAFNKGAKFEKIKLYKFFETGPDENDIELGEDYWFCMKAKEVGFDIYLQPDIILNHTGIYKFKGTEVKNTQI